VELRPTAESDLPALHGVFLAAIGELYRRHGFTPPSPPLEAFANQQRHVIATGSSVVALDGERMIGFGSAWARGDDWFLASLFVAPGAQARGVGRALLDAVWGEQYARRRTITDAIQPVSNALYARRGLIPATPILTFTGTPSAARALLEPVVADVTAIDDAAYGFDRSLDHAHWLAYAGRTVWSRAGEPAAYSYAFPGGAIGPVAGLDAVAAAAALETELSRAPGDVVLRLPGSGPQLVEVALRVGLRLTATPGLLLLSDGATPPTSLALAGYTLF
jgi:GNAT superfamily N-acetyltransferase